MSDRRCEWPECSRDAGPGWSVLSKFYCGQHYFPSIDQAFQKAYAAWEGTGEPTRQFRNLFSRHVESLFMAGGMPGKLSQVKIEQRGTSWKKISGGVEFSIERHLPAYRSGGFVKTVYQLWRFDLQTRELVLVNQQDAATRKLARIAIPSKPVVSAGLTASR